MPEPALLDGPLVGGGRAWWSASRPGATAAVWWFGSFTQGFSGVCPSVSQPRFLGVPRAKEAVQEMPRRRGVDRAARHWWPPRAIDGFFLLAGASRSSWLTPPRPSGGTPKTPPRSLSRSPGRRKCGECGRSSEAAASSPRPPGPRIRVLALASPSAPLLSSSQADQRGLPLRPPAQLAAPVSHCQVWG